MYGNQGYMQQQNGMMKMNYNSYQQQGYGGVMMNQQNFAMMQQASCYNGIPGQPPYYSGQVPYQQQFNGDSSRKHRNRSSCN
jgi:hypothetical protein